ncbi:8448_t:CDS:10 [Entrophospora sp. SA101]|nr:8448_t:CDS:10 [Entrophospora sp. SA101]
MRRTKRKVSYVVTHSKDDHGHLLGINSLALDATTINQRTGKPEGILYTAGRDGVINSWDLNLPFKQKSKIYVNGESFSHLDGGGDNEIFVDGEDFAKVNNSDINDDNLPLNKLKNNNNFKHNWEFDEEICLEQPSPKSTFRQSFKGHTNWVNDIVLCHNNETLISASSDRTLKLWHPHKSSNPITIGYHTDYIKSLAYASGPGWVASGGFDRKIDLWDIRECKPASSGITCINFENSPKCSIYALACNPSGSILASGSPEKIVRLWDPRSGKGITKFTGHTDNVRTVLVSDDGELVSYCLDTTIKLWSLTAQRCLYTFDIHSDSVWSLYSDHPRLRTFYAGSKDGLVTKIDHSGSAEIRDGDCVAICKESHGVMKLVALDNKYIWTATYDSSIKRWEDVKINRGSKNSIVKIAPSSASFGVLAPPDSEVSTLYSVNDDALFDNMNIEDAIPIRDTPDHIIEGQHGLVKHVILNNRRHVLTQDNSEEVALWDIIKCVRVNNFGKRRDIKEVAQEINTIESISNWCSIDTYIGALTVNLDETNCFDAEMYADEAGLPEDVEIREDQRLNLGKWVLKNLFSKFTEAEIKTYEETQTYRTILQQQQNQRQQPGDQQKTSLTISGQTNEATSLSVHQTPTAPLAAITTTGPFSAPVTTGTQQPDYFSNSHHNTPTSPKTETRALTPPLSSSSPSSNTAPATATESILGSMLTTQIIQPPPPVLIPSSTTNTSGSFIDRDAKLSVQTLDENNQTLERNDDLNLNSPTKTTSQINQLKSLTSSVTQDFAKSIDFTFRQMHHIIQPPFAEFPTNEIPQIEIPSHTTVIISEDSPEASTNVDLYRGTIASMSNDAEMIEQKAPIWLLEFLIKDSVKVSFVLKPHEDSSLDELPNGNSRLSANRMLRVRKILAYIVDKLVLAQPDNSIITDQLSPTRRSFSKSDDDDNKESDEHKKISLKPETWLELLCQDQVLPPTMTLATIKTHVWKLPGDLTMTYR